MEKKMKGTLPTADHSGWSKLQAEAWKWERKWQGVSRHV